MNKIEDYQWSKEEASILKALFAGQADAPMQRRAIVHLLEILCGINQIGFDPNNSQMTAFHSGRRWVARQVQNAVTIPLDKLVKEEPHERTDSLVLTATERAARAAADGHRRG